MTRRTRSILAALTLGTVTVTVAGCGQIGPAATTDKHAGPKIGIVVSGAFGDHAYFDSALDSKAPLASKFDATVSTYEGRDQADQYGSILTAAGSQNDIVFVVGFEMLQALQDTAAREPNANFVYLDGDTTGNQTSSISYRDGEGCFLAGALGASLTANHTLPESVSDKTIGFVGGQDAPIIRSCESGYEQGAKAAAPSIGVVSGYVGSFSDPTTGKTVNQSLNQKGSNINFEYAGLSGQGGFDNAKAGGHGYVIGAGIDQAYLAPKNTVASVLKYLDKTIVSTVAQIESGTLKKGFHTSEGLKEGSLAIIFDKTLVPASSQDVVNGLAKEISDGKRTLAQ
jgi:basic membrane protein A and related proteins